MFDIIDPRDPRSNLPDPVLAQELAEERAAFEAAEIAAEQAAFEAYVEASWMRYEEDRQYAARCAEATAYCEHIGGAR